jgi:hypothetical protein
VGDITLPCDEDMNIYKGSRSSQLKALIEAAIELSLSFEDIML